MRGRHLSLEEQLKIALEEGTPLEIAKKLNLGKSTVSKIKMWYKQGKIKP